MKTVSQLGSGKPPVGTTAYMGRAKHLMQCRSTVERGSFSFLFEYISKFSQFKQFRVVMRVIVQISLEVTYAEHVHIRDPQVLKAAQGLDA